MISLTVNGKRQQVKAPVTIHAFLESRKIDVRLVAVARNGEVVRRSDHEQVLLQDGDTVEIVRMVAGG